MPRTCSSRLSSSLGSLSSYSLASVRPTCLPARPHAMGSCHAPKLIIRCASLFGMTFSLCRPQCNVVGHATRTFGAERSSALQTMFPLCRCVKTFARSLSKLYLGSGWLCGSSRSSLCYCRLSSNTWPSGSLVYVVILVLPSVFVLEILARGGD